MPEWIVDSARVVQAIFSVFAFTSIVIAYLAWQSKQSMDQRTHAIAYSLTKNKDYFDARGEIEVRFAKNFREKTRIQPKDIEEGDKIGRQIKFVLAHWEIMAISIYDGIIDEESCFEMVGSTLVNTVEVLRDFIDERRRDRLHVRRYDYLLILQHNWAERLSSYNGQRPISRYEQYKAGGYDIRAFKRSLALGSGRTRSSLLTWIKIGRTE